MHALLEAAKGKKTTQTPVWLMRQAGRILPEYRAVRANFKNFVEFVKTPEAAAEVTIQPVDILGVDAAIIFSDILVIPEAMGLPYIMQENKGPSFPETIQNIKDVEKLKIATVEDLEYVMEALRITKKALNGRVPLIGFAGAPFTLFCYMIEGSGSKTFSKAKKILYTEPELSHQLLDKITKSTIAYLKGQILAGADLVQIFDSWAGVLSPTQYESFAIPYLKQICDAITDVPITIFAKDAFFARKSIAKLNCSVIGLDWTMDITESKQLANGKTLQGNLDPCALYGSFAQIRQNTHQMLKEFGDHPHIANLGHGLYPDISADHVKCFIEAVKEFRS
jgi:uroporphyrinogen decarboxylase